MGITQKPSGLWYAYVEAGRDPITGKRIREWSEGFEKESQARKWETLKKAEKIKGTYMREAKYTVAEYLEHWLKHYAEKNTSPRTYEGYQYIVERHIIPQIGRVKLKDLKPHHVQAYYTDRLENGRLDGKGGLSGQTVLHHHRLINEALEQAVEWEFIPRNVASSVKSPETVKKEKNVFDDEQLIQLYSVSREVLNFLYFVAIAIAGETGMRMGEVRGLTWPAVDFENRMIDVFQSAQDLVGKGTIIKEPKSKASRRSIPMSDYLYTVLTEARLYQKKLKLQSGGTFLDQGFVLAQETGRTLSRTQIDIMFNRSVSACGFQKKYVYHDLRHSFATSLLERGESELIVSYLLGHGSGPGFTLNTYGHAKPSMFASASKTINSRSRSMAEDAS